MKRQGTLQDVKREHFKSRLADHLAWRNCLARFWRIDLLWHTVKFRWKNARRRRVLETMIRNNMGFGWRDARPNKIQRKLGLKPQL